MQCSKKIVIFSDFDGTITERDVIVMIMEKFAPPEWVQIKDKILYERTITLKDGIEALFKLIDSEKKREITDYIKKNVKIRSGFKELLDFCQKENIDFNVLSGGLDFHIEPILENYKTKLKLYCNKADFSSDKIGIKYDFLPENCNICGTCGCCKIEIIEKYPQDRFLRVLIGDSLTDLAPSKVSDMVFARADLIKYLEQENIPFIPFNTFHEVQEQLLQNQLIKN